MGAVESLLMGAGGRLLMGAVLLIGESHTDPFRAGLVCFPIMYALRLKVTLGNVIPWGGDFLSMTGCVKLRTR